MNNRVNYTFVGFLVLLGVALMLGFTYWLLQPASENIKKKYLIYFDESVLGLNINAAVKYRGIQVGEVSRLRINPKNTEQVEVLISVLKTTPIKADTVAKLTSQGITGLSYINLSLGSNNAPPLKLNKGEEYPVIKTTPSFFENFEKSLGSVSTKVSKTLTQTERLLADENQKQFSLLLKNSAKSMERINQLLSDDMIASIHASSKNLERVTAKIDKMLPNINHFVDKSVVWEDSMANSFVEIKNSYKSMGVTMDGMKDALKDSSLKFSSMVPVINATMLELQGLMVKLEETLAHHDESPADIFYKKEAVKKGPGE